MTLPSSLLHAFHDMSLPTFYAKFFFYYDSTEQIRIQYHKNVFYFLNIDVFFYKKYNKKRY